MAKVSVIVPVYNAEKYLEKCIDSICGQTLKEIEIICVDDGSTDNSLLILQKYAKEDCRITVLSQKNQYAGVARNHGMRYASGKYLSFLDADDYFRDDMLEKMYCRAEKTRADIVICGSKGYDDKKKYFHRLSEAWDAGKSQVKAIFSKNDIPDYIFQLTAGWAWDKMYRTEFIRENKIEFQNTRIANDALFVDIAYAEAERISYINEKLVIHRTNVASSLEYTRSKWWMCGYDMLYEEKKELEKRNLYECVKRSFMNKAASYIVWNVCTITDRIYFQQFYEYTKRHGMKTLRLLEYPADFYYELSVWEIMKKVEALSESEFLLDRIKELNEVLKEKDNAVIERDQIIIEKNHRIKKKVWSFPEEGFEGGEKILIYGYGEVGKDFCRQVKNSRNLELAGVIDQNYEKYKTALEWVFSIDEVKSIKFDYIIIANMRKDIAVEMQEILLEKGINKKKIIWFDIMA